MKKLYFLLLASLFSCLQIVAANLNPYAYGLSSSYNASTMTLTVSYSLNAPATSVELVVLASDGSEAGRVALPNISKGSYSEVPVDLSTLGLIDGTYSWKLDVKCAKRSSTYESVGRVKKLNSPFSVDVDNNPNSPYFGRIYVTQPTTNATRGIYVYTPGWSKIGNYIDPDITINTSQSWYTYIHAVPYRIRVVQDGTGRLLTTSCDRSQNTHLWYVNPADLTQWTAVVTSSNLNSWTSHGNTSNKFANTALDIRESDDGKNWEILLYSATVNSNSTNFSAGYVYSGIYKVAKTTTNFKNGSYTNLTKATLSNGSYTQHSTIGGTWTGSMITANAQFDKYGGVLYASYSTGTNPTSSALIHRLKSSDSYKKDYADGSYLTREKTATAGIRFNHDFTRLAIAQGSYDKEIRFYTVTQNSAGSHPTLSDRKSADMISADLDTGTDKAYVIDIAWDYAQNIYAVVRNATYEIYGVYAVAANLGGIAVSTPAKTEYKFEVECPNTQWTININGQVGSTAANTELGSCALKIDNTSASWGTSVARQACTKVTVKATADALHKFLGWYDGSTRLSKNAEYSFYAVKNLNLTAKFEYAEYSGLSWYKLLKNNKEVDTNQELWELFMPVYNDYVKTYCANNDISYRRASKSLAEINIFFDPTYGQVNVVAFMTDVTNSPFKWLGDYILKTTGKNSLSKENWAVNIGGFFNGSKVTYTWNSTSYTSADFSTAGQPAQWLPLYRQYIANLPQVLHYNTNMPTDIGSLTITGVGYYESSTAPRPKSPTWYISNDAAANSGKLLAWRLGSTSGKIMHGATESNQSFYATWVDKHLDESIDNSDVIQLMSNPAYTTHAVTVTRKMQAGMYNTVCFPFDVELEGLMASHPLKDAEALEMSSINTSLYDDAGQLITVINFTPVATVSGKRTLKAGKAYLIKPKAEVSADITFTGVARANLTLDTIQTSCLSSDGTATFTFHSTINPTTIPEGALILVANNRLAINTEDQGSMKGMRGYITIEAEAHTIEEDILDQAAQGRVYLSIQKPTTTSVPLAPEAEQSAAPEVQKIMRNGQIYILRGEEVYTITGTRAK